MNADHRSRKHVARGCENDPVALSQVQALDRPLEDTELVSQHGVLKLNRRRGRTTGDNADKPPNKQVREEEEHPVRSYGPPATAVVGSW